MRKVVGFIVGAGILVAAAVWFITNMPGVFQSVIDWAKVQVGMP